MPAASGTLTVTDVLAKQAGQLLALIKLTTGYKIRNGVGTLAAQTSKEIDSSHCRY